MTYSKQEKNNLSLIAAAVLLGVFTLNPMARAQNADTGVTILEKAQERPATDLLRRADRADRAPAVQMDRIPATAPERIEVAAIEERDGMSLDQLNRVLREPLQVKPNESNTNVAFLGDVPYRCVYNAQGEINASIDYDKKASKEGQHVFRVRMPLCENIPNFKKIPGEKMVKVSAIPGARAMNDVKGKIVLASGFKDSDAEPNIEELKRNGEAVVIETEKVQRDAERAVEAAAERNRLAEQNEINVKDAEKKRLEDAKLAQLQREKEAKIAAQEIEKTAKNVEAACKENDFERVETAIGNYPELKEHVAKVATRSLRKDIESATNEDEAIAAWEKFSEAGEKFSWEDSEINKGRDAYISKRFEIMNAIVKGDEDSESKSSLSDAEKAVDSWSKDFKGLDSRLYAKKENKEKFAEAYGEIGVNASKGSMKNAASIAKAVSTAEKNFNKAKKFSSSQAKTKADGALTKLNSQAFTACIKASPTNMAGCESKYRDKVTAYAEKYAAGLQKQAASGDEEASAEVQAFAQDYLKAEGYGQTATYQGFGKIHQMPGYFEQAKIQTMQEVQMRQQQMMMQQMYGGAGMGMQGGMAQQRSTGFFGF